MAQTAPPSASSPAINQIPAGIVMTREYVSTMGRTAYLWGWPLVNARNRRAAFSKVPEPGLLGGVLPIAPTGYITMLTDYIKPDQRFVTCPNQDVTYGFGFAAVDKEPIVVQIPDFGERFWVVALYDARTDEFSNLGKQYGTKPGNYLVVGPKWTGAVPAGITEVVRAPTDLVGMAPRIFLDDTAADREAIQPYLNKMIIYPLGQYDGKEKVKDWKKVPSFPSTSSGGTETRWVDPETFFDELAGVLKEVPPMAGEEALYASMQSLLDAAAQNPAIKRQLKELAVETEKSLMGPLFEFRNQAVPVGGGWTSPPNGAQWGFDYLTRAAVARSNMYVNAPKETRYFYLDLDGAGGRLNGAHRYTVTYAKDRLPPVNGFWSLTLYNQHHFFEPNSLNRFSLGTKNKTLKYNADGSLTLYVQAESPGADKESNWLPSPKGEFSLYQRAYWAKEEVLQGRWTPPAAVRSN